jgi:large subunit ribosomal protein L6
MNAKNVETKIIFLPKNIEIYKKQFNLLLKTKYGYIKLNIPKNINIYLKNSYLLYIDIFNNDENGKTWEIILKNIIKGCSRQYLNRLILKGVGYKAFLKSKDNLELKIGYSHPIDFSVKNFLNIDVFKNLIIQLNSPLKDQLGSTAASLKSLKKVDMYKGKGILYKREKLNLKTGKKA